MSNADPSDQASEIEENERMVQLAKTLDNVEKPPIWFDKVHCIEEDCGLEIESERIVHGFFRCYSCQSVRESRNKLKRN